MDAVREFNNVTLAGEMTGAAAVMAVLRLSILVIVINAITNVKQSRQMPAADPVTAANDGCSTVLGWALGIGAIVVIAMVLGGMAVGG